MNSVNIMFLNEIREIVKFWFSNEKLWFNASTEDDLMITAKYETLLINVDKDDIFNNIIQNVQNINNLTKLGLILLYDQIGRHICRIQKKSHTYYFNKIYAIAKSIIDNCELLESYIPEERVFILLVYRHTFDKAHIETVIEIIQKWRIENNLPIYKRFYHASLNSLAKINNNKNLLYDNSTGYMNDTINSILDLNLSPQMDEVLSFNSVGLNSIYEEEIYKIFESSLFQALNQIKITDNKIGISVSGGCDSMVCTLLTYAFSYKHHYIPIIFSVNYGNRVEQNIEIYMVNKYLNHLNQIYNYSNTLYTEDSIYNYDIQNHYVRVIDEIKRTHGTSDSEVNDRDLYEDFTRNIRFDSYKNVSASLSNDSSTAIPFILGHNRDDSLENVISNIKKERSYQNLFGMNLVGNEKDVTLFRPLLSVWKKDIVTFAQKYKVPFVYDSTPSWSERGKMRDILFPFLNQFDSRILDGLFSLSTNFKEIYKVYEDSLPEIKYNEDNAIIEDKEIYFEDYFKKILQKISVHFHIKPIKNKAITHLVNTLQNDINTHKITLSKELSCIKSTYGKSYYDDSLLSSKKVELTFILNK